MAAYNDVPKTETDLRNYIKKYSDEHSIWLEDSEREVISKILALYINCNHQISFNTNVLIYAEKGETAENSGEAIVDILEQWFSNKNGKAAAGDEAQFLEHALDSQHKNTRIFLVRNFQALDIERLSNIYEQFERQGWQQSVILCASDDAVTKLKDDSTKDYRLFHYLCGTKLHIVSNEADIINQKVLKYFEQTNVQMSDPFKEKLNIYISAVYPEAALQNQAFVDDLIYRIRREHFSHLELTEELTEIDVPYSVKAETMEKEVLKETETADNSKKVEVLDSSKGVEFLENSEEIKKLKVCADTVKKEDSINILITNVSTVPKDRNSRKYIDEENNIFSGEITNEAPVKSISYRLGKNGYYLNEIIFIESDTVREPAIHLENQTHIEYLKNKIDNFLGDYKDKTKYSDVSIKDEPSKNEVSATVFEIYGKLMDMASEEAEVSVGSNKKNINIYIESNGGVRYVLTMLLSLTNALEKYYDNVHITEITSMVYGKPKVRIMNTKDVYDTAQIIGIADEFINYGRTNSLQNYIERYMGELSEEQAVDVQVVLNILYKTAEDIQLCRTAMMLDDFYGTNNLKCIIDSFLFKYNDSNASAVISILNHLLKLIMKDFNADVYRNNDTENLCTENIDNIIHLPKLIEWCTKKSFVMQALTLCSERIPEYLLKTGRIQLSSHFVELLNQKNEHSDYEASYYFVAHVYEFIKEIQQSRINMVLEIINGGALEDSGNNLERSLQFVEGTPDIIQETAQKIWNILLDYRTYTSPTDDNLDDLFNNSESFEITDLNKQIQISKQISTSLRLALRGKYINRVGEEATHPNLNTTSKRIEKICPELIEIQLNRIKSSVLSLEEEKYDSLIDRLYSNDSNGSLSEKMKNKYSKRQSKKFYIGDAMDTGDVTSNISRADIQTLLYCYSICKEQRNLSNHAHVSEDDVDIALNTENLLIVIRELLRLCAIGDYSS